MTLMVSLVEHTYDKRKLAIGEEFEAEPRFVPVLIKLGRAKVKDESQYVTRDLTPGSAATEYMTKSRGNRHKRRTT